MGAQEEGGAPGQGIEERGLREDGNHHVRGVEGRKEGSEERLVRLFFFIIIHVSMSLVYISQDSILESAPGDISGVARTMLGSWELPQDLSPRWTLTVTVRPL